ncbi:hypothetical protein POG22_22080 [Geitlerinema sp. CS-897]|nr:hypothetical protein [Geitlerinema sp. CS-897]
MSHRTRQILQVVAPWILGVAVAIYFTLATLPSPYIFITSGLDASWSFALTETVLKGLQFGRDVIFTYGPLGYLAAGSIVPENVLTAVTFKIGVHIALVFAVVICVFQYKNNLDRVLWIVSSLFLFHAAFSIDYKALFLYLILLLWSVRPPFQASKRSTISRGYSLFLGIVAGFLALIKFTLGVATVGALFLVQFFRAVSIAKTQTLSERNRAILAVWDSVVGATSTAFVFVAVNPPDNAVRLLLYGAIAVVVSGVVQKVRQTDRDRLFDKRFDLFRASSLAYGIYSILLLATVLVFDRSLLDFVRGSLEVSSGYSSAMSYISSPLELGLAPIEATLVASVMGQRCDWRRSGFYLGLAFVLWIAFKHGFVRQDAHVLLYFFCVPFIASLVCAGRSNVSRQSSWGRVVSAIAIAVAVLYVAKPDVLGQVGLRPWPFWQSFTPKYVHNQIFSFNVDRVASVLEDANQWNFERLKLPAKVREHLGNKTVDIVPWELTLAPANGLNWQPRPTLQSYLSYTKFLDRANAANLDAHPRDHFLYQFRAIDGRHAFFDEPETFSSLLCRYRLSPQFPTFVQTEAVSDLMVFDRRETNPCQIAAPLSSQSVGWGETATVPQAARSLVRASISVSYSPWGKFYKTLFRAAPVRLKAVYRDGGEASYRLLPGNAENAPIVSHLPRESDEALVFFQSLDRADLPFPAPVASIAFETDNRFVYAPKIEVTWIPLGWESGDRTPKSDL